MLLLLIRHGVTAATARALVGRLPGYHLSDAGRAEAEGLSRRLEGVPVTAIYSSPLERALETAAPLAAARGLDVVVEDSLVEVDYGDWSGREYKDLRKTDLWKRVQARPADARFPGGEAVREAQARIVACIERIRASHPDGVVVAVSHADMIKAAVAHYVGLHLDLFQRLHVATGSLTAIALGEGAPALVKLSESGDLAELVPRRRRSRLKQN